MSGSSFIYKTMPHCAAGSLGNWLASRVGVGYYEPREVLAVVLPLADALHYVHDRHITHQNFKLSNLLLTNEADETDDLRQLQVTLCDFAITQDGRFLPKQLITSPLSLLSSGRGDLTRLPINTRWQWSPTDCWRAASHF